MKLNIANTPKDELIKRGKWRCVHHHSGVEHPNCYDQANNRKERIGFFDIETEDLRADYGIMFSYVIEDFEGKKRYEDIVKEEDFIKYRTNKNGMAKEDTRILRNFVRDISNFDRLIGHYSCRFDSNFARTRAVICGIDFPKWGSIYQTDTWVILKKKFALKSNSLESGNRNINGSSNKNHLSLALKHGLIRGKKWAQDYCLDHNRRDVQDTRRLYVSIRPFMRLTKSSI